MLHRLFVAAVLALVAATGAQAASVTVPVPPVDESVPVDDAALVRLVTELDREMFDAYNAHDVDALMAMFAPDLEFFHDTGGLLGYEQVTDGFKSVFASNKDIRRELVPGSLEVYPIKGYGAIEVGSHTFCHTENEKPVCGTFRFVQVWRHSDGAWKVSREISYGH
jgi:ketosteroid isomerase-like protein